MTKTANYQLNQYESGDAIKRADFNADNAKIDAALSTQQAAIDAKAEQSDFAAYKSANDAAVAKKADRAALDVTNTRVDRKADQADLNTTNANLAAKANQTALDATNANVAAAQNAANTALATANSAFSPANLPYVTYSYVGNGLCSYKNPTVINVGFRPSRLIIQNANGSSFFALYPVEEPSSDLYLTWTDTGVEWFGREASDQFNVEGTTYYCMLFH